MSNELSDLEVWKKARVLRNDISTFCKSLPDFEKYKLVDQLIRASRSVTANIAEGHGRYHFQENIQFCRQARGSMEEIFDHLTVALDEGYMDKKSFDDFVVSLESSKKLINGYIAYLKKRKDEK